MLNPRRVAVAKAGTLYAPAESVFTLLADWGDLLKWWPKYDPSHPGPAPLKIERVELIDAQSALPRRRLLWPEGGSRVQETLLLEDHRARRIYYTLQDEAIPGVCNYVASTWVDETGTGMCTMQFSSSFDVIDESADVEQLRSIIESMYERHILAGFAQYFAQMRGEGVR